jgi:hypothetical protein
MKMKKTIFAVLAVCLFAAQAQAQWGIQAGVNVTTHQKFNNDDGPDTFQANAGYFVGATCDLKLFSDDHVGLNTGLLFVQRNVGQEKKGVKSTDRYSSLELPVNLKVQIPLPVVSPFVMGGIYFDYGLQKKQWGYTVDYDLWGGRLSGGFTLGAGVDISKTFRLTYQYDWGVNSFMHSDVDRNGPSSQPDPYTAKNRGHRMAFGILF